MDALPELTPKESKPMALGPDTAVKSRLGQVPAPFCTLTIWAGWLAGVPRVPAAHVIWTM